MNGGCNSLEEVQRAARSPQGRYACSLYGRTGSHEPESCMYASPLDIRRRVHARMAAKTRIRHSWQPIAPTRVNASGEGYLRRSVVDLPERINEDVRHEQTQERRKVVPGMAPVRARPVEQHLLPGCPGTDRGQRLGVHGPQAQQRGGIASGATRRRCSAKNRNSEQVQRRNTNRFRSVPEAGALRSASSSSTSSRA